MQDKITNLSILLARRYHNRYHNPCTDCQMCRVHHQNAPSLRRKDCVQVITLACPEEKTALYIYPSVCLCFSVSLSLCRSVSLSLCRPVALCVCVYLSLSLSLCLSVCLSVCLSIYLSIYLSICLSICLSIRACLVI